MSYIIEMTVKRGFEQVKPLWEFLNPDDDQPRGYIAGSYAAFMLSNQIKWYPNDVDIFATKESYIHEIERALQEMKFVWNYDPGGLVTRFEPTSMAPIDSPVQVIKPHPQWDDYPMDSAGRERTRTARVPSAARGPKAAAFTRMEEGAAPKFSRAERAAWSGATRT